VLWNHPGRELSLDDRTFVGAANEGDVRSFSVVAPPGKHRIAYVTDSRLYVASAGDDGRVFNQVQSIAKFVDARSVVATDPNGDGVSDLVVADAEGLWLLQAGFL
jgi:hypothetical protein